MGDPTSTKTSDPERRTSTRTSRRISLQQDGFQGADGPGIGLGLDLDDDYSFLASGGMVSDGFRPQNQAPASYEDQFALAGMVSDGFRPQSMAPAKANDDQDDEDDHFALGGMISDGFRPQPAAPATHENHEPTARPHSPEVARSGGEMPSSPSSPSASASRSRPNRSSISKPPRGRDSFTLRHDGAMGHVGGPSLPRLSTASSQAPYVANDTPYQGPTGPSHPYQSFSQDTRLARTISVTTTSTTPPNRPESEYNGPRGPSHPYSMYPQNPVEEANPQPVVPAIPVGFIGAADPYQRRLGPEGEELADIIGPDGHTEELPPYTRYPDELYARKIRATEGQDQVGESAATAATISTAAITAGTVPATTLANVPPTISGAGGIGLAARNPEFDSGSVNTVGSPQSRHSSRSFAAESHHEINTAAAAVSEKPKLNGFQKFARRKACGVVPYWAIGLTAIAIVIVIVIVGAVIGSLLSHRHKPPSGSPTKYQDSVPTVTITFDATPIPTPANLPALAQGKFGLPINLNQAPNTCFNDTSQTAAWSCNVAFPQLMSLQLSITRNAPQLGMAGAYEVLLTQNASINPGPPGGGGGGGGNINSLSYGASAPAIEPAMNMQLVNDTFDLNRGPAWFRMLPYNKTVLVQEGLLSATTSSSKQRRNGGGFIPSLADFQQRKGVASEGDKPWLCTWPDTFVEIFIYATQNSSYAAESTATITTAPQTTATATGTAATATSTGSTAVMSMSHVTAYPRAVKLKERRVNESPRAFCVQVTVNADNTTSPILNENGDPENYIAIEETEQSNGMDKRDDGGDMSDCGCMWFAS